MCCEKGEEGKSLYQALPDHIAVNGDPKSLTASSMIRSHSVSGDLHGVPPDPVAADILRKEPEQETFVRLKITPTGMASFPSDFIYFIYFCCFCSSLFKSVILQTSRGKLMELTTFFISYLEKHFSKIVCHC